MSLKPTVLRELVIIITITVISFIPRILWLTDIPPGLHGDEAWVGMWARRLLQTGSIEVYTGDALGNVTGPVYLVAMLFNIFGDSVFSIRFASVLAAVASVPLMYILLRNTYDTLISTYVTISYSFSTIVLYYSRTGFFLIHSLAPLIGTLILFNFFPKFSGLKRFLLIGLCAICIAIGVYNYNAFPLTAMILIGTYFVNNFFAKRKVRSIMDMTLLAGFLLILLSPLISIAYHNPDFYFAHHRLFAITNHAEVKSAESLFAMMLTILKYGLWKIGSFFHNSHVDYADGYSTVRNIPIGFVAAMCGGIVLFIVRRRFHYVIMFLLIIAGSFLTVDGTYRRIITAVPFIFIFIAEYFQSLKNYMYKINRYSGTLIIFFLIVTSMTSTAMYFKNIQNHRSVKDVFVYHLMKVFAKYDDLPADKKTNSYFYSARWSCDYESIQYLYPDFNCVDRSYEFGTYSLNSGGLRATYILMDPYFLHIDELRKKYPQGTAEYVYDGSDMIGIIYST